MDGKGIYRLWQSFDAKVQPLREEHERVRRNSDLTEEARTKKLWEIGQKITELYDPIISKARKHLPQIEAEALQVLPQALEAQAATRDPQVAINARDLAQEASFQDLEAYALDAVNRGSLSKAHGLRQAVHSNDQLEDTQKAKLLKSLDSISADTREGGMARLVGFKVALAGLEGSGSIDGTPAVLRDPVAYLTAYREAGRIPVNQDGDTVQLTEPEIQRLLKISGVPAHPPGGKPLDP